MSRNDEWTTIGTVHAEDPHRVVVQGWTGDTRKHRVVIFDIFDSYGGGFAAAEIVLNSEQATELARLLS